MRISNIKFTDLAHFALGFVAPIMGLEAPVTIVFVAYELGDLYTQIKAKEKEYELGFRILEEKYELRKDIGVYVLGLVIGALVKAFLCG
jgi:uncharacterized protein (DUF2062 family)